MVEITIHLRTPHPEQKRFIESKKKRKIIRAGRRGGKTVGVGIEAVEKFMDGFRVLYAAPTQDQVQAFWFEVIKALSPLIDKGIVIKNESTHVIEFPGTKKRIRAKTAWNADTLRGDYADLLILDEWQLMDEDAWARVGAPMLMDNDGDAIFIYTPPSLKSKSISKAKDPLHASKMYKKAEQDDDWGTFTFTTHDNPHISAKAIERIRRDMTALAYKQEILAEDMNYVPGALWNEEMIESMRVGVAPDFERKVIGIDPQGKKKDNAETGIIGIGLATINSVKHAYVISDKSVNARPKGWGQAVVNEYKQGQYDRTVAEVNYGGEMVEAVIKDIYADISYKAVSASRGKIIRAEPISAMCESGDGKEVRIHLVGDFPELENEMCTYTSDSGWSPNRLDAFVWACTELLMGDIGEWDEWGTSDREAA